MMNHTTIEFWEFEDLLDDFEREVADNCYLKMEYAKWRKMNSPLYSGDTTVFIEWDQHKVDINIGEERYRFMLGDKSFGDFIKCWFLDDIDSEDLYPTSITNTALKCGEMLKESSAKTMGALKEIVHSDGGLAIKASSSSSDLMAINNIISDMMAVSAAETTTKNEENSTMKGFNFDFGPINSAVVRMSVYGLAVKNKAGSWVAYDAKNEEIMDVDVFNFDGSKFMYRMPVPINDVAVGDVVVHMSVPMFVVGKSDDGKAVYAVDPVAGERKEIMLTKSPFGFNFVTKVVNFLGNAFNADASNPFGNLGLMAMLSEDNKDMKEVLPFMLMANGGNTNGFDLSNPMVMYMVCKEGAGDLPMMLALSGAFNKPAAPHVCNCGQCNQ